MAQGKLPDGRNERSPYVSSAQIIALVDDRRKASIRYNFKLFNQLLSFYDTYRGVWQGRLAQFRNNITIPFTFAMIQSDVARKVQTSFGTWPIVSFEGYAPEDVGRAKKNEVLISAQMKDCDSVIRAVDFFLQADICGTGVARYGWKRLQRKVQTVQPEEIAPGLSVRVKRDYMATIFDGPIWEPVDRLDFWQQPARKRIPEMDWAIHRYWADLDNLMDDVNSDYPYFDPRAIKLLKDAPLQGQGADEFNQRKLRFRNEFDYQARQSERFSKPVEIWEMHGLVPDEFAPDGVRHRCIAVANRRVVIKNQPSQQQKLPFLSYAPMPDPYSFDGIGKAEVAYGPQRTVDRLANQKLDALDMLIDPMIVASNSTNINTQNLFSRAGKVILVDGAADDSNLRPLTMNMQGLQAAYAEMGQLWEFMQLGAGINDIVMGLQPGNRETARGFLGRQENVLTRLSMEAKIAEEMFIEPLANSFRDLDRMLLDMPHEVKILGSLATVNPITGMPYSPESTTIDADDLMPDYRARAVGASQMMGRSVRQQNLMGLLQMMSANPVMMQLVNWANFARQAFELFDFKNIDELLVNQVPMISQIAQQTGQSPEAIAGQATQTLPQVSPEMMGMLGQGASPMTVGT